MCNSKCSLGIAPTRRFTSCPSLNSIKVGMPRLPYRVAIWLFSSTSTFAIFSWPLCSSAISSRIGAIVLHVYGDRCRQVGHAVGRLPDHDMPGQYHQRPGPKLAPSCPSSAALFLPRDNGLQASVPAVPEGGPTGHWNRLH